MSAAPGRVWIVGRGGLLGRYVVTATKTRFGDDAEWLWPRERFAWHESETLQQQLAAASRLFFASLNQGEDWAIVWTAGAGVVGTSAAALAAETAAFRMLLDGISAALRAHPQRGKGAVFLSSSAGGVYGNCQDIPITERSAPIPISPYGHNKLQQEQVFRAWAAEHAEVCCGIGRISNLLGVGQNLDKPQGLVSQMSRSTIWRRPIHIYVPLDTIRDYLHARDCADQIVRCLTAWLHEARQLSGPHVKLLISGNTLSVADVIGCFARLGPARRPKVICSPSVVGLQQPRCLRFQSVVGPDFGDMRLTAFPAAVSEILAAQLKEFCSGRLTSPR